MGTPGQAAGRNGILGWTTSQVAVGEGMPCQSILNFRPAKKSVNISGSGLSEKSN
jgi:hypothetical protein